MIKQEILKKLKNKKNLLAFSAGIDSTALFYILNENNIEFDIAIVNYNLREQSKDEVAYAKELSEKYNKLCHIKNTSKIEKNLEAKAREIRYNFFNQLSLTYNYQNVITAHHLGDRFEWMLMQFCKGAGCVELSGMKNIQKRNNYTLIRPLLHIDKNELLEYLNKYKLKYFIDESNFNQEIKRNEFRHNYAIPLLKKYKNGIKKSFDYIDEDKNMLIENADIQHIDNFTYFKSKNIRSDIFNIDKHLKSLGLMISAKERELLQTEKTLIVGRKYIVSKENNYIFILPYKIDKQTISKEFKEECRTLKISPKLRSYFFENKKIFQTIKSLYS